MIRGGGDWVAEVAGGDARAALAENFLVASILKSRLYRPSTKEVEGLPRKGEKL